MLPTRFPASQPSQTMASLGGADDKVLFKDQNDTWVDRYAPPAIQPFMKLVRIDRPIGTWLVLLPAWWGVAACAAPGHLPDAALMAIFGGGAFLMRGAGCTMNDMWDRRFDSQVARTRLRPLASGRISLPAALAFLAGQLSVGFGLLLQLPPSAIQSGFGAVAIAGVYPAMKRVTNFPQAVLGIAMNYGIPMAWASTVGAAVLGAVPPRAALGAPSYSLLDHARELTTAVIDPATFASIVSFDAGGPHLLVPVILPMYAGAACWTMVYDTLYAHQDKDDDAKLGLKSTALWMADRTVPILTTFALSAGALWTAAGLGADLAWPYYVGVGASTGHMLWQVWTAKLDDRLNLTQRFTSNTRVGWIMLAATVAGRVLQ